MRRTSTLAAATVLIMAGCDQGVEIPDPATVEAPKAPPVPDPPMTAAKSAAMLDGMPVECKTIATLKYEMSRCVGVGPEGPDDARLIQEIQALRGELEALDPDEVARVCSTRYADLASTPKPRECW